MNVQVGMQVIIPAQWQMLTTNTTLPFTRRTQSFTQIGQMLRDFLHKIR